MSDQIQLRDVVESDLTIFFDHQRDVVACQMASFVSREWPAFQAHWQKIMLDNTIDKQTILFEGVVVGNIVCFQISEVYEVGYWIGREYWGKGIATRALDQFLRMVPIRPLFAYVVQLNIASQRVLEKCGFFRHSVEGGEIVLKID